MTRFLLFMVGSLAAASSLAASYTTTQITDNNYNDQYPKLNARGDMAWTAWVNPSDTGWTVFLYDADTKTSSAISGNTVFFDSHQINANGDVIWTASDGHDQEVYLYSSATHTTRQLTNNDNDDTNPQLSDNGNASWLEKTPTNGAVLMNYDATTMSATPLVFTGATRQGLQTMNADGDVMWTADVGGNQDVLLYKAASGSITNISNGISLISSNPRLVDNGDIVWEAYDATNYTESLMRYNAANGSTSTIATNISGFMVSSEGDIVWTNYLSGTYSINTYDPMTDSSKVIATNTGYRFNVAGISARGDVAWTTIVGTDWVSRVYNAETDSTIDLTVTQGAGVFEQHIADNGDVAWSLGDGTDYEVYTYQTASGTLTQLTNNNVDDGVISMNANGALAWDRWDPTDSELFLAVKNNSELTLDVSKLKLELDRHDAEIKLMAEFTGASIPSPTDTIAIKVGDATLLSVPFTDFRQKRPGVYKYKSDGVHVSIDFNRGKLKVSSEKLVRKAVDLSYGLYGLDVKVDFGSASAVDNYTFKRH